MRATVKPNGARDLHSLQEELKKLGICVVSGRQETVISVKIKGLAGRALVRGLRLADQLLQEKIKHALKACTDPSTNLFTDPTFGPSSNDPDGAAAICNAGRVIPSNGGSQHQAKVLDLLQRGKLRWERPIYAQDNDKDDTSFEEEDDDEYAMTSTGNVFASNATLFADGMSSGDVIQGNLGDCWFLSALSVVATRSDLLQQTFWRKDQHKSRGLFVCKFMKNFVWNYVLIDDRLPVFGYTDTKAGKPYFARCRNPNELWVSLLEKAYAKLHGSYEALIGGFIDCALNDLTGMCSEQVILKEGFPGFSESPYTPAKSQQKYGDPFWEKLTRYKESGTLMGCSIQPSVSSGLVKETAVESSAGNGLYFKHAYALVDVAEIRTAKGELVRLVKLRNPWGMGEWTGPWSDSSEERTVNEDAIAKFFKLMKRNVGANAEKRVFMTLNAQGIVGMDEICQEDVVDINANDGTFFMSFDAWTQSFTHFFAGIDFPDSWHGRRSEGAWNEANCGGNTTKSTWINNPHFELNLEQRARVFVSLSQEDPRGSDKLRIVPVGFHICSLSPIDNVPTKCEIKEPAKKLDAYYRLYKSVDRESFQSGKRFESLPPAIIPGTVIPGIDDDGVPQVAYTFKQAVSVEATMEAGRYCIIPSMYMRTDRVTGNTNVGSFWISVYSDKATFRLEGGEKIVEEEEGDDESCDSGEQSRRNASLPSGARVSTTRSSKKSVTVVATDAAEKRRKFENDKEELWRQAQRYGIGVRELRVEFGKTRRISKAECRHRLQKLGFHVANWDDEKLLSLFRGTTQGPSDGMIQTDQIVKLFTIDHQEEQMVCELPDMEEDGDSFNRIHQEGVLEIELHGATRLAVCTKRQLSGQRKVPIQAPVFSIAQCALRRRLASEILERDPSMIWQLGQFVKKSDLFVKTRFVESKQTRIEAMRSQLLSQTPVAAFYELLEKEFALRTLASVDPQEDLEYATAASPTPVYSTKEGRRSSFVPALSSRSTTEWTLSKNPSNAVELHRTMRIRDLETKRSLKLAALLQHKQQALGDAEKTASLPRLIGGTKSGSNHVECIDCGTPVLVRGRANRQAQVADDACSYSCRGANCVNVFCPPCYTLLPLTSKMCEECYQHEVSPNETFGEQLRVSLIEKLGASEQQRAHLEEVFQSFDADGSGSLSPQEFEKMLRQMSIQPALTPGQIAFLVDQFDANGDGDISLTEFRQWVVRDHVWVEAAAPNSSSESKAFDVFDAVIVPVCNEILELVDSACAFSSTIGAWSRSVSTTTKCVTKGIEKVETGALVFQRVVSLGIASSLVLNAAGRVFEQADDDRNGSIDRFEFRDLLATLGIHLHHEDVVLLMNRLGALNARDDERLTIERSAFLAYVDRMTNKCSQTASLYDVLIKLDNAAEKSVNVRERLESELHVLHENITQKDLRIICKTLNEIAALSITLPELQLLARALKYSYQEPLSSSKASSADGKDDHLFVPKSSGDFLARLVLSKAGDLMKHVKAFNVASVCHELSLHLRRRSGMDSTTGIWRTVFGLNISDALHLDEFIAEILQTGFLITSQDGSNTFEDPVTSHLRTSLMLSLAIDAVRTECQSVSSLIGKPFVSFNLFQVVLHFDKIKEIELKFNHALTNFMQLCQGEQHYLVTIALDDQRNLVVRARDPVFKFSADLVLCEEEYDYANLLAQVGFSDFERRRNEIHDVSREAAFTTSPRGLITGDLHPQLNASMVAIVERIRASFRPRNASSAFQNSRMHALYLSMIESDSFVCTLRHLLSQMELPFFWSVSSRALVLSIDSAYLEQQSQSNFQQLVADTLSLHSSQSSPAIRAFAAFVAHTASSLLVQYHVVGQHTSLETSWQEFQDFVAGQQTAYAVLELHPQGSLFTTPSARASGCGAVQWNFKAQIKIDEPKLCDHRLDRPVVFTDTVKISCLPGHTPLSEQINFVVEDKANVPGHFVLVSVRRALPSGLDSPKPRLYCTAYEPLTACDYTVEGYPSDWSIDFFDETVNPLVESQWQTMLSTMRLGAPITPKLAIAVYSKHPKTDQFIGECEVSIGSAIAQEGHNFEERVALSSSWSKTKTCGGLAALTLRFDVKKALDDTAAKDRRQLAKARTGISLPLAFGAQYLAGEIATPRAEAREEDNDERVQQMQSSIAVIESAKRQAQEQVKELKAQIQRLADATQKTSEDSAERWRRRVEQARQEQIAAEETHSIRLAKLQQEIRRLIEDQEKQQHVGKSALSLQDCKLSAESSAYDLLAAIRGILTTRCPDRPYNGLKKALAAEAEVPGKVLFAVLNEVLGDFGFALSSAHRSTLSSLLDPEMIGRVSIEDFLLKLSGHIETYKEVRSPLPSPEKRSAVALIEYPEPVVFAPTPPPVQRPVSPIASPLRASNGRSKLSWQEMKTFLVLNLPEGWETRFTEKGRPYFCNHANRSTQWKHPRPEIETIFSDWVQENEAYFPRKPTATRTSKQKRNQ